MNQASYKVCPQCGQASQLHQPFCGSCGHQFQSQPPTSVGHTQFVSPTMAPPGAPVAYGAGLKSKLAAGLLGLFFGALGVHNFYLGYNGRALAQLLITLLTCGFGAIVTGPWALIESILIFTGSINTDAQGLPLRE